MHITMSAFSDENKELKTLYVELPAGESINTGIMAAEGCACIMIEWLADNGYIKRNEGLDD